MDWGYPWHSWWQPALAIWKGIGTVTVFLSSPLTSRTTLRIGVKPHSFSNWSSVPLSKQETRNNSSASIRLFFACSSVSPCEWTSRIGQEARYHLRRFLIAIGNLMVKVTWAISKY
jgi:hypothetical protein